MIENNGESFLGMDGGKIDASVWFCGVEFGSDLDIMSRYYKEVCVNPNGGDNYQFPFRTDCPEYFLDSIYDKYLATMYIKLFIDGDFQTTEKNDRITCVLKDKLYNKDSKIFKLNLFPLAKKDTSWDDKIENELDLKKEKYYGVIFEKRQSFIRKLFQKYSPKIIICTATKDYKELFVETFVENNQKVKFSWSYVKIENKNFKITEYDNGKTKLVIIPFLGRGNNNLNSYNKVIRLGEYLRKRYKTYYNKEKRI